MALREVHPCEDAMHPEQHVGDFHFGGREVTSVYMVCSAEQRFGS